MSWVVFVLKNWAIYAAGVVLLGVTSGIASGDWRAVLVVTSGVVSLVLAAATADYLRPRENNRISVDELQGRASPTLPPLTQIDPRRPLLGVGKSGEFEGCTVLLVISKEGVAPAGSMWIFAGKRWGRPVDGFRDAPIADLKSELRSRDIWVLPQSKYSDWVARSTVGQTSLRRLLAPKGP